MLHHSPFENSPSQNPSSQSSRQSSPSVEQSEKPASAGELTPGELTAQGESSAGSLPEVPPQPSSFPPPHSQPPIPLPALMPPLFELGRVYATPGALEALRNALTEPAALLNRHQRGDWGDLCAEDRAVNRKALLWGQRLLSSYTLPETEEKVWIITEADRSETTLLLPSEY